MAIGETGTLSENTTYSGEALQVTFTEPLSDPVVALTATNYGGNKFSLRVIEFQTDANGDATGFTFTIDEWENHDGAHPAVEDINWIAIESGTHVLPDGRLIEAGYANADSDGEDVTLSHDFPDTPVVLTTVASDNHASHVDSDPTAINSGGFTLSVEEAERMDGIHGMEKVGWIAVQSGGDGSAGTASNTQSVTSEWDTLSLGASFEQPIVLAETQSKNETDTGNVIFRDLGTEKVRMRFEEDTSADGETTHGAETVALVAFEAGMILCFTAGTLIDTPHGPRPVERLRPGDGVLTRDNGVQELLWTGGSDYAAADLAAEVRLRPVRIPTNAFGPGLPCRDTRVSPHHRLLVADWRAELCFGSPEILAPAKALFATEMTVRAVRYIHLLFARHELVTANGMPMESFHPGEMCKSALCPRALEEVFALFPRLRSSPKDWGPAARLSIPVRQAATLRATA
jgi:hypothetical protein